MLKQAVEFYCENDYSTLAESTAADEKNFRDDCADMREAIRWLRQVIKEKS